MEDMRESRFWSKIDYIEEQVLEIVQWMSLPVNRAQYKDEFVTLQVSPSWEEKRYAKVWLNFFENLEQTLVMDTSARADGDFVFRRGVWVDYIDKLHEQAEKVRRDYYDAAMKTAKQNHSSVDDARFFQNSLLMKNGEP